MRNSGDDAKYRIGALERGLSILDTLGESPGLSLMELASRLDVPKGSLFRQLRVLEASGFVTRAADTKRYWLGSRLIHLGYSARRQLKLADVAEPFMAALRDRFNESVHLGVLDQDEVVHVQATPSHHPVKMVAAVGERTWAHVSALGKVLLAWADPDLVEGVVLRKGLPRFTDQTLCTRAELEADLEQVRQRGYAIDDEESAMGLRCIAAPVRRGDGRLAAALSVSSPADRLSLGDAHAIAGAIREAADSISEELGWRPDASRAPVDEGTSPQTWRD